MRAFWRIAPQAAATSLFALVCLGLVHLALAHSDVSGAVEVALYSRTAFTVDPVITLDDRSTVGGFPSLIVQIPITLAPHAAKAQDGSEGPVMFLSGAESCKAKGRKLDPSDVDTGVERYELPQINKGFAVRCQYDGPGDPTASLRTMQIVWFSPSWAKGFPNPNVPEPWNPVQKAEIRFHQPEGEGALSLTGGNQLGDGVPGVRIATIKAEEPITLVTAQWTSEEAAESQVVLLLLAGTFLGVAGSGLYDLLKDVFVNARD